MAKNYLNQDDSDGLTYIDGFRFGFGLFLALVLGFTLLSAIGLLVGFFTGHLHS